MKTYNLLFLVFALLFCELNINAQEAVVAAGGDATDGNASVSFTVGQVAYYSDASIIEGVQVPYEISIVNAIDDLKVNLELSVYPNPTSDFLTLIVDFASIAADTELSFELYNMSGKSLKIEKIISNKTTINLSSYVPATYFVRVKDLNKVYKVFKVVKK